MALQPQIAFFPLWPALLRLVHDTNGTSLLAVSVALAGVTGIAAVLGVWLVARQLCGAVVAARSSALWTFFPGSLVSTMGYAEGLTIAASAASLLALLRQRRALAGIAAGVATGVQPEALVLVACCAWAAGVAVVRERRWVALCAPLLSLAGVAGYFAYIYDRTGDALRWYHVEKSDWGSGSGFGHVTVGAVRRAFEDPHVRDAVALTLGLLVVALGLVALVLWRPPAVIWIYTAGVIVLALGSDQVGARRRVIPVAPLLIALARWAGLRWAGALTGASGVLLGAMTMIVLSAVLISP